jgi:hypothetical protein
VLVIRHGVWIGSWILWTQLVTTSNLKSLIGLHTMQTTIAHDISQSVMSLLIVALLLCLLGVPRLWLLTMDVLAPCSCLHRIAASLQLIHELITFLVHRHYITSDETAQKTLLLRVPILLHDAYCGFTCF